MEDKEFEFRWLGMKTISVEVENTIAFDKFIEDAYLYLKEKGKSKEEILKILKDIIRVGNDSYEDKFLKGYPFELTVNDLE